MTYFVKYDGMISAKAGS
jgi:hypothetical protein